MSDVTHLRLLTQPIMPVDGDNVSCLEELLALANNGSFKGIAYVTINSEGAGSCLSTGTGFKGEGVTNNIQTVLGAVSILHRRILDGADL